MRARRRSLTRLAQKVTTLLGIDELRLSQLPAEAATRMRRIQIRGAIDQMRAFLIGNTVFAPVLAYQAWDTGINGAVIGWTIVMLMFSWWLFFNWNRSYHCEGTAKDMARFVAETRANAALWCLGMVLFYPYVSGDGKTILVTVMTGSLALGTVGFAQAPMAAFWFLGIQAVVLIIVPTGYGLENGSGADLVIGLLALFASGAIFNATLERGKSQMRTFKVHESLAQKTEVIDLLLKDYEEQGSEWIWQTDCCGNLIMGPQKVFDLMGFSDSDTTGINLVSEIERHVDLRGADDVRRIKDAFAARTDLHNVTLPFRSATQDGTRWIMMRGRPQFDGDQCVGYRGIFADATSAVEAQKQVAFLADHDPLTGAYNRNVVQSRLDDLDPDRQSAIACLIDLDGFKQVNDSYGHGVGDQLLQLASARLLDLAGSDTLVARLGGDEFLILVEPREGDGFDLATFTTALLSGLSAPFLVDQFDIAVSASIGTATFPRDTRQGTNLLIQADLALYQAKQDGRNQWRPFVETMQIGLQKRMIITERLKTAIQDSRIVPHYQPQYCTQTHQILGFEALARWNDAELGVVGPDIFIPIAEETGMIHALGEQVLRTACLDALRWAEMTASEPPIVSVNLSPVQVTRSDIVQLVAQVLADTGLPATRLEIEITEGVLIYDMEEARRVLQALSRLGVRIALDDFGTGYSSLSYIRALPLDRLKIDRSFILDLDDPTARPIVQTIINLCKTLGLAVVAEGVETDAHVNTLSDMQVDMLQGYYFSAARPAADVPLLFENAARAAASVARSEMQDAV